MDWTAFGAMVTAVTTIALAFVAYRAMKGNAALVSRTQNLAEQTKKLAETRTGEKRDLDCEADLNVAYDAWW